MRDITDYSKSEFKVRSRSDVVLWDRLTFAQAGYIVHCMADSRDSVGAPLFPFIKINKLRTIND
jgi:hypothetical protein